MSNTLFLISDVWANLSRGIVVFSEGKGKNAFYTTNAELISSLKDEPEVRFDEYGEEISSNYGVNGLVYNLLTKEDETIYPTTFGGVISTVAFAELPAVKDENEKISGYKVALVLGEVTGALAVSTRFLEKHHAHDISLRDIGVQDDKVVVVPAYAHVRDGGVFNPGQFIDGLYLLKS